MILDVQANGETMAEFQTGGYGTRLEVLFALLLLAVFILVLTVLSQLSYPDNTTFILVVFGSLLLFIAVAGFLHSFLNKFPRRTLELTDLVDKEVKYAIREGISERKEHIFVSIPSKKLDFHLKPSEWEEIAGLMNKSGAVLTEDE